MKPSKKGVINKQAAFFVYVHAGLIVVLSLYVFLAPAFILVRDLRDPALTAGEIPRFAFRWHRQLSASIEPWARQRVASGQAAELSVHNIAATEWPIFSAVFYLWTTEALQDAWEQDSTLFATMPSEYAQGAIEAAAALIRDPNHAAWVQQHWGSEYLERENLFYRMLLISGLTSYQKLSGNRQYETLLAEQVNSMAEELDASPYGLLDDYPGECYPIDILPCIAAIQRADAVLGIDHSAMLARAVRGFEGTRLDPRTDLPAYVANSRTGQGFGPARGVGLSYMLIWAPELWPETAQDWYAKYEQHFWQQDKLMAGFREFAKTPGYPEWYLLDVDAGPVLAGYGTTASAFGIGAARANGQLEHAYALSSEALAASWPLPDGRRLLLRLLSNVTESPFVGEAILLFNLTRQPLTAQVSAARGRLPLVVYLMLALYVSAGVVCVGVGVRRILRVHKRGAAARVPVSQGHSLLQWGLCALGVGLAVLFNPLWGLPVLLLIRRPGRA